MTQNQIPVQQPPIQKQPQHEEIIRKIRDMFDTYGAMKYIDLWQRRYSFIKYLRRYFENNCVEKPIIFAMGRLSTSLYEYWIDIVFPCGIGVVEMGVFNPYEEGNNIDAKLYRDLKKILVEYGIPVKEKDYGLDW